MEKIPLSLRDYFAAHAPITGVDANESLRKTARFAQTDEHGVYPFPLIMQELIRLRWEYADLMIAARGEGGAA